MSEINNVFAHEKYVGSFVDWYTRDGEVTRLEIIRIDDDSYPIVCRDIDGAIRYFTADGRYTNYPSHADKPCLKWPKFQSGFPWDYGIAPK